MNEENERFMPDNGEHPSSDHSRFLPPQQRDSRSSGSDISLEPSLSHPLTTTPEDSPTPLQHSSGPSASEEDDPAGEAAHEICYPDPPAEKDNSIWARFSHLISWAMVPMLMPVYGILLIFSLSILNYTSAGTRFWITAIIFGLNVALPALIIVILKYLGIVDDLGLNGRKERMIPYLVSILALGATAWFLASKQAPQWVWLFYLGGAAGGLINMTINFRWKISAHAAGIAGIIALLIRIARDGFPQGNVILWLLIAILLAGLTGSARLYLRRHTFLQVMAGYLVGFLSVYLVTAI